MSEIRPVQLRKGRKAGPEALSEDRYRDLRRGLAIVLGISLFNSLATLVTWMMLANLLER